MNEGAPNQETVSPRNVIESLRQNPDDLSVLEKFLDARNLEVRSSKDALALNIELAEIYREAGMLDAAYEAFLDARDQAKQEGEVDLAVRMDGEALKLMIE
jgi:hypothetical protein